MRKFSSRFSSSPRHASPMVKAASCAAERHSHHRFHLVVQGRARSLRDHPSIPARPHRFPFATATRCSQEQPVSLRYPRTRIGNSAGEYASCRSLAVIQEGQGIYSDLEKSGKLCTQCAINI